ncbi:Cna B-type domain-containing protein, partial [Methanobrevibacter sp.]|uniref:Cna B-type domain-containing protein n=1 Tax=Methanobrevibacter sp. TaxID=66852 RepID=UPI00388EFD7E
NVTYFNGTAYIFTVTNTRVVENVTVNVTKVWNDNDNQDGVRPFNITVNLVNQYGLVESVVLTGPDWNYTFENLPKYLNGALVVYNVTEDSVANYNVTYFNGTAYIFTVTNTRVVENVTVNVTKVWNDNDNQDGFSPVNITVNLVNQYGTVRSVVLTGPDWNYTFENLPKYLNGALVVYNVTEDSVANYSVTYSNGSAYIFTVTNAHIPELINITVEKVWTDNGNQDGVRPENVTVNLIKNQTVIRTAVLNDANNWTYTFLDLDKYENNGTLIVYSINETEVINYTAEITGDNVSFVINNTHVIELINVTVVKVWNDGNNVSGNRPANVTVVLLADGNAIRNATLSVSNDWTFTFEGLDKFKHNGTLIKYSIDEVDVGVPGYTTEITNSTPYYWIVNNTFVPDHNKTANETKVFYNESVKYNITITNIGTGVYNKTLIIVDSMPYGLEYNKTINITGARVIQEGVYDKEANNVTWIITDIDPATPAIITILVRTYDIGNLTNNVTLIGPNGYNKTVNETIEVEPIVDVSVVKTVDVPEHFIGDVVVWTVKVSNAFNGTDATDVRLNETLPSEFTLINYTVTKGTYANNVWTIGTMGNGTEETLTIYTRAKTNGTFTNYVNVTCNETEWNYTNNYDNATVNIIKNIPIKEVNNSKPFYHENVTYYLTVVNPGNVTYVNNLTVVDSLPDGVDYLETLYITGADVVVDATVSGKNISWVITNISAGTTAVIAVKAQANAVGIKVNNETIIYPNGYSQKVNATIDVQPIVDVSVVKTVDKPEYFVGDIVVWTVKVANAFNGTAATDVKLYEALPGHFALIDYVATKGTYANDVWTIGTMANGTEETLTLYTRALLDGTFTNYVNVTCNETEWNYTNNYDNETVIIKWIPDINKTVNDTTPFTHEFVEYYLTVSNTVDIDFTNNLTVIDSLPDGLVYANEYKVEGAKLLKFVVDGQKLYWTITDISANSSAVITVKVLADKAGNLTNNATLVPPSGNNITVNCTITPIPRADLEITKLVSKKVSHYNDRVVWTIIVKNNGPDTAENAVVSDKLPKGLVYVSDDSKGAYNHESGIWKVGNLAKGQSKTLKIVSIVRTTNATIINFANVTSDTPDPNETNNKCNNSTTVPPEADLMLIKDVDKYNVRVGENFTFTIVVINLGPDVAVNTRAFDVLPDGLKFISYKASRGTYDPVTGVWDIGDLEEGDSVSLTIVAQALRTGHFINEAYVVSDTYDPDLSNNNDSAEVIAVELGPPVSTMHPTGNPIVMVLLSLLAIVGVTLKRKL